MKSDETNQTKQPNTDGASECRGTEEIVERSVPVFPEQPDGDTLRFLLAEIWALCRRRHQQILNELYEGWQRDRRRLMDKIDRLHKTVGEKHMEMERQQKIATALDARLRLWEMGAKDRNLRRKIKRLRNVKL